MCIHMYICVFVLMHTKVQTHVHTQAYTSSASIALHIAHACLHTEIDGVNYYTNNNTHMCTSFYTKMYKCINRPILTKMYI